MNYLISASPEAKVKDTIIPDFHPGVQADMKFKTLSPFIPTVTREHLLPYIGRAFHTVLVTEKDTDDADMAEAVELAQRALVYYMIVKAIPTMLGNLSALGFQTMNDSEGTSNVPSQWVYFNAIRNGVLDADRALDELLMYLDSKRHLTAFATYSSDKAIAYRRSQVFRQVRQMDEYLNIQGSRRAWNVIVPYFLKAEKRSLRPVLGDTFFAELAAIADAVEPTAIQKELLDYCRAYVAEIGLLAAIPHLSCVISGDGIVIVSNSDGFRQENSSGLVYNQAAIARIQQDATTRAAGALKDLQYFLRTNAAEFENYTVPTAVESTGIVDSPGAVGIF